jgi:hypothetical protein
MLRRRLYSGCWEIAVLLAAISAVGCNRQAARQVTKEVEAEAAPVIRKELKRGLDAAGREAEEAWLKALARKASSALGGHELAPRLSLAQTQLFRSIDRGFRRPRWVGIAPRDVIGFVDSFKTGARSPERFLGELAPENQTLLRAWQSTPKERRVFLVGSGQDLDLALKLRADLEERGFRLFFYKFCSQCSSEVVGAFYGTAGEAILMDTRPAGASRYVSQEVSAAIRHQEGRRLAFLLPAEDLLRAQELARDMQPALAKAVPIFLDDLRGGGRTHSGN